MSDGLKDALKRADMTQRELAVRMRVGETQVSVWARGNTPNLKNQARIARILKLKPEEIWPNE